MNMDIHYQIICTSKILGMPWASTKRELGKYEVYIHTKLYMMYKGGKRNGPVQHKSEKQFLSKCKSLVV